MEEINTAAVKNMKLEDELFAVTDDSVIGADYLKAKAEGDRAKMIRALAAFYRNKKDWDYTWFRTPAYRKEVADRAVLGKVTVVNVDWDFPDGKIDFLFNATRVKPPLNNEWMWQLGRTEFWLDMGKAFLETGDAKYASAFTAQLRSWVENVELTEVFNRADSGWRTIECGLRLRTTWPYAFDIFKKSELFDDESLVLMIASMHKQSVLNVNHFTGGNWAMIEADGVFTFSSLFPELIDSKENRIRAGRKLTEELAKQILPDGMHSELSPDYQYVVFYCVSNAYSIGKKFGREDEFPDEFPKLIRELAMAAVKLTTPRFTQPRTNDCFTIQLSSFTDTAHDLFPDVPEFEYVSSLRKSGRPPLGKTASVFMPYAGFCVMRSGWDSEATYLCFDVGSLGTSHCHQDKLNINLYKGSRELIYDDGGGQYDYSEQRKYALGSKAHNTVAVDGFGQTRNDVYRLYEPADAKWVTEDEFDSAYGVYDSAFGPQRAHMAVHERKVDFLKPDFFIVTDGLTTADGADHDYELLFHTDTLDVSYITDNGLPEGSVITNFGKKNPDEKYDVLIVPLDRSGAVTKLTSGRTEPDYRGWYVGRNDCDYHHSTTVSRSSGKCCSYTFRTLLFVIERNEANCLPVLSIKDGKTEVSFRGKKYLL